MTQPYDVVIAGAGPGGLTAALALKRQSRRCLVVERAARDRLCADVGGGYHIGSTTLAMLDALGVGGRCRQAGIRFGAFHAFTDRGRPLKRLPFPETIDMINVRRSSLQAALLEAVGDEHIRYGTSVTGFVEEAGAVRALLSTGDEVRAAVLVGADGVNSAIREALLADGPPRFCGLTCCWGRIGLEDLERAGVAFSRGDAYSQMGSGASFAGATIDAHMLWSANWRTEGFERSEDAERRKARVAGRFAGWASPTPEIIASTPTEVVAEVGIWDREPAECWYRGRVVLIGDAAHPMTPFLGQGANSAMLDAYVLVHHLGTKPHEEAFAAYQHRRKRVVEAHVRKARSISEFSTADRIWKRLAMATMLRMAPRRLTLRTMLRADELNDISDLLVAGAAVVQ